MSCAVEIGDAGLVLGAGTVLARMARDPFGSPILGLEEDCDRLLALLAAAYGRPASPDVLRHVEGASSYWRRGEKALANIRLAFAQLPSLEDRDDAWRLFLAEELLDGGMSPGALMKGLGLEPPRRDFVKYDPNQPRIPAGNGRSSGRWRSGGGEPQDAASARVLPPAAAQAARSAQVLRAARGVGTLAQGLFEAVARSAFLSGLARLAAAAGRPGLTLGLVLIPTPAGRVSQGAIPGDPDLHYSFDEPAGVLRLYREGENGRQTIAYATRGAHDIFVDQETGAPIARLVSGSLVFDADSLAPAASDRRAPSTKGEPKLCPDPGPDVPHGASERAWAYQEQISRLNNPQRPLKRGEAVSLIHPSTQELVVFDDCRESDGAMIEAKGPGYAGLMQSDFLAEKIWREDWEPQAERQIAAAGSRDVEWFFAEPEAAKRAEKWFGADERFKKIKVIVVPAEMPL
jgi:hypothetical protein